MTTPTPAARIRPATPQDAGAILDLLDGLNAHVGAERGKMSRRTLINDAFCDEPKVRFLVADRDGMIAGYAAWCDAYETEHAMSGLYMIDLFVTPEHRGAGLARRLVAALSAEARRSGHGFLWWAAAPDNEEAAGFYKSLGGRSEPMIAHALFGAPFDDLADEAETG